MSKPTSFEQEKEDTKHLDRSEALIRKKCFLDNGGAYKNTKFELGNSAYHHNKLQRVLL